MGWVSPTGHLDPGNVWTNEVNVYDEDEGSFAHTDDEVDYLELTLTAPISCDKVRIYADDYAIAHTDPDLDIDLYYSGAWHNIFSGLITKLTWVEKTIGSTQTVEKARVKFNNTAGWLHRLHEFEFNEVAAPPPSYIPKVIMVT